MGLKDYDKTKPGVQDEDGNTTSKGGGDNYTGSAAPGKAGDEKRYMQSYLQVIYNLYGNKAFSPAQKKLAAWAFQHRFSASSYAEMLRREDPMFVKSKLYKDRIQDARNLYKTFRPGRPVPHNFLDSYARSNMNKARLQQKIESSKWFKREFAGWTEAQKVGSPAGNSPQTFINYRNMWNNALRLATGRQASKAEQRMMFSSGMTGDEVNKNFADLFGGQEALKWATGMTMDRANIIRGALSQKFGKEALARVMSARQTQSGFLDSKQKQFDIGVDEASGNLSSSRI